MPGQVVIFSMWINGLKKGRKNHRNKTNNRCRAVSWSSRTRLLRSFSQAINTCSPKPKVPLTFPSRPKLKKAKESMQILTRKSPRKCSVTESTSLETNRNWIPNKINHTNHCKNMYKRKWSNYQTTTSNSPNTRPHIKWHQRKRTSTTATSGWV